MPDAVIGGQCWGCKRDVQAGNVLCYVICSKCRAYLQAHAHRAAEELVHLQLILGAIGRPAAPPAETPTAAPSGFEANYPPGYKAKRIFCRMPHCEQTAFAILAPGVSVRWLCDEHRGLEADEFGGAR